jgi:hypothetical protein
VRRQLSTDVRVDLASVIDLVDIVDAPPEYCVFGIELQVENKHDPSMFVRLNDYAERLSRLPLASKKERRTRFTTRKVYEVGLCMWNCDDVQELGVVWGVLKNCLTSSQGTTGVQYPNVSYPLCCAQIFLGELVNVTDEVIKFMKTATLGQRRDPNLRAQSISAVRDSRRTELKGKFDALFGSRGFGIGDIDVIYNSARFANRGQGFSEADFLGDDLSLQNFRIVESYELLEFFSIGSTMSQDIVDQLVSKTVRGLYMSIKINEGNISLNRDQARDIWLSKEFAEALDRADIGDLTTTVLSRLLGGPLSGADFDGIVASELRDPVIQNLRNRVPGIIIENDHSIAPPPPPPPAVPIPAAPIQPQHPPAPSPPDAQQPRAY